MFLSVRPFSYNSIWLVEIYVRDYIRKSFLVRAIMQVVRNTVYDGEVYLFHDGVYPKTKI